MSRRAQALAALHGLAVPSPNESACGELTNEAESSRYHGASTPSAGLTLYRIASDNRLGRFEIEDRSRRKATSFRRWSTSGPKSRALSPEQSSSLVNFASISYILTPRFACLLRSWNRRRYRPTRWAIRSLVMKWPAPLSGIWNCRIRRVAERWRT